MIDSFPLNQKDSTKFKTDSSIYVLNKEDNTWKNLGLIDLKLVSDIENGLIYPELYDKIKLFKKFFGDGFRNFSLTDNKPYFYLFNNSDRMLKFTFDGNNLWIDINKSFLNSKILARSFCVGQKGIDGFDGKIGKSGVPAVNEKFISSSNGLIDIDVFIDKLNDNPISIRGYDKYRSKLFEIKLSLDGQYIDEEKYFEYIKLSGNNLIAKLIDNSISLKIRQIGLNGDNGSDGVNYVHVQEYFNDIDVIKEAVLNFDLINNNFIFSRQVLEIINCVFTFKANGVSNGRYWVGSEITTRECKDIEIVDPFVSFDKQKLDLPLWTPLAGCYDQRRYDFAKFDWYKQFDLPFDILDNPEPKLNSCAVPFWFCGNSGNMPCDDQINIEVPIIIGNDKSSESSSTYSSSSSQSNSESSSQSNSESSSKSYSESSSKSNSSQSKSYSSESSLSSESTFSSKSTISFNSSESSNSDESSLSVSESTNSSNSESTNSSNSYSTISVSESTQSSLSPSSNSYLSAISDLSSPSEASDQSPISGDLSEISEISALGCEGYSTTAYVDGGCPGGAFPLTFGVSGGVPYFDGSEYGIYSTWNGSQWVVTSAPCGPHTYLGGSFSCIDGVASGSADFYDEGCACYWSLHM